MKAFLPFLFAAIGLLGLSSAIAQPFVQTYYDFEPDLDGIDPYRFGFGVSVSIEAEWAVVGALNGYDEDGNNLLDDAGAVYVYYRNQKLGWDLYQKIVASDRAIYDYFGQQVAVFQEQLLVAAPLDDDPGSPVLQQKGSVYFFELDTAEVWQERQKLLASDAADGDHFGEALALGEDVAMIGVPRKDYDAGGGSIFGETGAVYVFTRNSSGLWIETQQLFPATINSFDHFGTSVSIRGDWAAVGVPQEDEDAQATSLPDAGAVYLYHRDSLNSWQLAQILTHSDREIGDFFGQSVNLGDSLLIAGAIWEAGDLNGQNPLPGAGSAYLFRQQPNGQWIEIQKILAPDRLSGLPFYRFHFGHQVAIEDSFAVVSKVFRANQSDPGQVFLFQEQADGSWVSVQEVIGFPSEDGDLFGYGLGFDGHHLIAGAPGYEAIPNSQWGVFKIFELCEQNRSLLQDTTCAARPIWFGGQWVDQSGSYLDSLTTATGCDSVLRLELVVETVQTGIAESDSALTSLATSANYQWLDCGAGDTAISGATSQQFVPSRSGIYAVVVDQYGCTDTSACVAFLTASISAPLPASVSLLPNPSQGEATLTFSTPQPAVSIHIYDLSGKLVATYAQQQVEQVPFRIPGPAGVYLIEVVTRDHTFSFKHILQP